jgi:hypothetical protein
MQVFVHHIYEYEKGLRNLVLHTTSKNNLAMIVMKLGNRKIDYKIYETKNEKLNIFFGAKECVEVIKKIGKDYLVDYTAEEDFILGIMLGYDRRKQCERFMRYDEINRG